MRYAATKVLSVASCTPTSRSRWARTVFLPRKRTTIRMTAWPTASSQCIFLTYIV